MYPYLRFARVVFTSPFGPRLTFDSESVLSLRIWPGDIDLFPEVNNGRHLTLMDLGRFDLGLRSRFANVLHRKRWGLTVGGASVRFRRRVPPFRKVRLRTKIVGYDERWLYFHQRIERGGTTCSAALLRVGVTSGGRLVPTRAVLEAADMAGWDPDLPAWVRAWIEADELRPWPPDDDVSGEGVAPPSAVRVG
jgi:acyl-CoA thioesterase FadM